MSFINSIFLFALAGAALPAIIHLIRKMRAKKVLFSSLLFLKATPKELIKRRRLRDLILLAVRTLMLILLAFIFARPVIEHERIPFSAEEASVSTVILIDNSFSMRYEGQFDRARTAAADLFDDARDGDEFAVVAFSDEARQLTNLGMDTGIHRNAVENLIEPTYRTTDLYKPLRVAEEILKDARNPEKRIVIISDFQESGIGTQLDDWNLPPDITVIAEKTAPEQADNAFVRNFRMKKSRIEAENIAEYNVEIDTDHAAEKRNSVSLTVNGREIETQAVAAEQKNRAYFQQRELNEGLFQGYVSTPPDKLPADDRFYFTFLVSDLPGILCVDGGGSAGLSDQFYLGSAFDLGEDAFFGFTAGTARDVTAGRLGRYKLAIITNVPSLSEAQVSAVRQYAESGGTALLSFGGRTDAARMSANLEALGVGRVAGKIDAFQANGQDAIFGEFDTKHPVFDLFAETGSADMFRPKFRTYLRIDADSSAAVLSSFDTGDPLLIEKKSGRGRILVYASTFSNEWTDLPVHEFYIPFLYRIAEYAASRDQEHMSYPVGGLVALEGEPGQEWEISGPDETLFKVTLDETGRGFFRDTETPGNYRAAGGAETLDFSVNVDRRESLLDTRDTEEVIAAVSVPSEDAKQERIASLYGSVEEQEKEQKLWRWLLVLLIGLFLFENWYANRRSAAVVRSQLQDT